MTSLFQEIPSNYWMVEILQKIINEEELTDSDLNLWELIKSRPLPPGGIKAVIAIFKMTRRQSLL